MSEEHGNHCLTKAAATAKLLTNPDSPLHSYDQFVRGRGTFRAETAARGVLASVIAKQIYDSCSAGGLEAIAHTPSQPPPVAMQGAPIAPMNQRGGPTHPLSQPPASLSDLARHCATEAAKTIHNRLESHSELNRNARVKKGLGAVTIAAFSGIDIGATGTITSQNVALGGLAGLVDFGPFQQCMDGREVLKDDPQTRLLLAGNKPKPTAAKSW